MSKKGLLIVSEIIGSSVEPLQLFGCFTTPFPIKEIYKIKHSILPVKTLIGKKGIAYFGEVNLKIYCVNAHHLTLHLVEECIHFRGFALFAEAAEEVQPTIATKAVVQDVFVEEISAESIKIFLLLIVEITFTREKQIETSGLIENPTGDSYPKSREFSSRSTNEYHVVVEDTNSGPELIIQDIKIE